VTGATIEFHFTDVSSEADFIRAYLTDAWPRFEASEYWDHGWFWRYGQFADFESGPDGGFLRLVFDGDPDALIDAESDRWEKFDGLKSWDCNRYDDPDGDQEAFESLLDQQQAAKGAVGGEREYRFKALTARLALDYYRTFDDPLPAVAESGADDPKGIGAWALLHDLLVQCGYHWYDETDITLRMLQNRLKSIAGYAGADAAREEYDRIREAWIEHEAELEDWLADAPTGTMSEP